MFAIMQNLLYGCQITAEKHISDSMMYQKLAGKTGRGRVPVYGKYFYLYSSQCQNPTDNIQV
jgi:hypothetical protein